MKPYLINIIDKNNQAYKQMPSKWDSWNHDGRKVIIRFDGKRLESWHRFVRKFHETAFDHKREQIAAISIIFDTFDTKISLYPIEVFTRNAPYFDAHAHHCNSIKQITRRTSEVNQIYIGF